LTFSVDINNERLRIPIIQGVGFGNVFISEKWMINLLSEITKIKDGAYFDVGVNIGQSLLKLRSVDLKKEYIGFEPNPVCINYTTQLIRENNFMNTTLIPVGISDTNLIFKLSLYSDDDSDPSASIVDNFRKSETVKSTRYVPCFNILNIRKSIDLPMIGILKIDIEGAELEVISEFESLIEIHQPFIQVEILPVYDVSNQERLSRQLLIESIVNRINYCFFRIHYSEIGIFIGLQEISTIGIHANLKWCDYLIIPQSENFKIQHLLIESDASIGKG
jgi:FkbM family methyltransferase